ncbi:MAG TPA: glyceraldehyde-3-phosphate dehydrogenase [Bacteroidales bacterium]|jgi:glyceraldehyde 3-phosphate dehydrogenase|nr:glyceraldehyde-3-phosphate dehydrogenase [Bacteroidales bacterium]
MEKKDKKLLGINGLGRIGKLTLWEQLRTRKFDGVVINVGREVGRSAEALLQTLCSDSTYGRVEHFLYGSTGFEKCKIEIVDRENLLFLIDNFPIKILNKERNPYRLNWKEENVQIVIDCTGKFLDPTISNPDGNGDLRGHLVAGAQKVIISAPFKIKQPQPESDTLFPTMIYGINHHEYQPIQQHIISAASCTTTALAHMMKPLLEDKETSHVLTASLSTVHAATNSQSVLDSVPGSGSKDLRKNRSVLNNIILSSTGSAKTLEKVLPQVINFGFMADSIRIPTSTVSLIALNITFTSSLNENKTPILNAEYIQNLYRNSAKNDPEKLLYYSEKQNVSMDMLGFPAAVVIEGNELHTRTGFLTVPTEILTSANIMLQEVNIPVTHAKIMGWYDNEYGSYVTSLCRLTEFVAARLY